MTRNQMRQFIEKVIFPRLLGLREDGQKEYAGGGTDSAFSNFERIADELRLSPQAVLWVFAMKHKDGIASAIRGHRSQREDVRGRIADLIVYLCLLWGMFETEEPTIEGARIMARDEELPG